MRIEDGLPALKLFSLDYELLNLFLWGDIIYIIASIIPLYMSIHYVFINDNDDVFDAVYVVGCWVFLLDSIAYMAGYLIYVYIIQESLRKGVMKANYADKIALVLLVYYFSFHFHIIIAYIGIGMLKH